MSEILKNSNKVANFRWNQLATTSTVALLAYLQGSFAAGASDGASKPSIWIELGGQLSRLGDGEETFAPSVFNARPSIFDPSQPFERPSRYSLDETGEISLEPNRSDWVFSAAVRYGRSTSKKHVVQQTTHGPFSKYNPNYPSSHPVEWPAARKFADTSAQHSESHLVLDFQAGKDVGLGMFGSNDAQSVISLGVRFAQFSSRSNISLKSDPDWHFSYKYRSGTIKFAYKQYYHSHMAGLTATRSFHGLGPSLSWKAATPVAGDLQSGELSLDLGLNVAVLFGRQRAEVHHHTTSESGEFHDLVRIGYRYVTSQKSVNPPVRSHSVAVPNVGALAGATFRIENAKVSFGYRADFFFGAMDGGIDSRKSYDRNFYGPYINVGLGL